MDLKQERGNKTAARTYTPKKWGISRAEWQRTSIAPDQRTAKLCKAYEWLRAKNTTYDVWIEKHEKELAEQSRYSVPKYWIRTSELLLKVPGVEVAAFPILYPRACSGDTDLRERQLLDDKGEASIFTSHLRKLLSSCTAYILQPKLTFLLYDIGLAHRLTCAIHVAEKRGFSTEITTGQYTISASYWRHEQDISCDIVRQMASKCDVKPKGDEDRTIYEFCSNGVQRIGWLFQTTSSQ